MSVPNQVIRHGNVKDQHLLERGGPNLRFATENTKDGKVKAYLEHNPGVFVEAFTSEEALRALKTKVREKMLSGKMGDIVQ